MNAKDALSRAYVGISDKLRDTVDDILLLVEVYNTIDCGMRDDKIRYEMLDNITQLISKLKKKEC